MQRTFTRTVNRDLSVQRAARFLAGVVLLIATLGLLGAIDGRVSSPISGAHHVEATLTSTH